MGWKWFGTCEMCCRRLLIHYIYIHRIASHLTSSLASPPLAPTKPPHLINPLSSPLLFFPLFSPPRHAAPPRPAKPSEPRALTSAYAPQGASTCLPKQGRQASSGRISGETARRRHVTPLSALHARVRGYIYIRAGTLPRGRRRGSVWFELSCWTFCFLLPRTHARPHAGSLSAYLPTYATVG